MQELRGLVSKAVVAAVSLPIMLSVTLGLGLLLGALGDATGWAWCGRLAAVLGAFWVVAIIATAIGGALLALKTDPGTARRRDDASTGRGGTE